MSVQRKKTEYLSLRLTPEMKAQLQARAEADGRTITNYLEKLIREKCAEIKTHPSPV